MSSHFDLFNNKILPNSNPTLCSREPYVQTCSYSECVHGKEINMVHKYDLWADIEGTLLKSLFMIVHLMGMGSPVIQKKSSAFFISSITPEHRNDTVSTRNSLPL